VKKGIAFFDFDGTITTKDTLLEFIKFYKGNFNFYLGFLLHAPWLLAMKFKLMSNQSVKEKILKYFFSNENEEDFKDKCTAFHQQVLPGLFRSGALKEINKLKEGNTIVVIVSASPENWIRPWTEFINVELIASRLEVKNGMITGKIVGKNCHGQEKVRRIKEKYVLTDYTDVYAYGDTSGDKDMLSLAKNAFYKPFR
jgi:HAD superfamily hydrolase (TIGR01490 family)